MRRNSAPGNQEGIWRTLKAGQKETKGRQSERTEREQVHCPELGHYRYGQFHILQAQFDQGVPVVLIEIIAVGYSRDDFAHRAVKVWDRN
jgi:hypothetical protein